MKQLLWINAGIIGLIIAAILLLGGCGPTVNERCASASNPKECLQVAQAGGDVTDYLTYGMAGYMLSSALNGSGQRQTVIVQDPRWHGYRRPIPSYVASRDFVSRKTTVTTKRSAFGGTKTTRSTYTYRPSYRSSFKSR